MKTAGQQSHLDLVTFAYSLYVTVYSSKVAHLFLSNLNISEGFDSFQFLQLGLTASLQRVVAHL